MDLERELWEKYELKDDHLFRMTDDTGIFQHCKYGVPDPAKGYTTDDNARALIAAVMLYEQLAKESYKELIYRYISFLLYAQNEQGMFRNFMTYNREFIDEVGSEDCFGRCLWALGFTLSSESVPVNMKLAAKHILDKALPNCDKLNSPRAKAYSTIGLGYLLDNRGYECEYEYEKAEPYLKRMVESLAELYCNCRAENWHWFEDIIAYGNEVLPWAMLVGYKITGEEKFKDIGLESLAFLDSKTFKNGYFKPVGCNGWLRKEDEDNGAEFDEQPLEACEAILAYLEAYRIIGDETYVEKAIKCFKWFEGENSKKLPLIDPETGGCYDGITQYGVNLNQGAESLISYMISALTLRKMMNERVMNEIIS